MAPWNMNRVAREEGFLLTILLTIASRDDFQFSTIHHHCCKYTKSLLLEVLLALPSTLRVGTVEGLLVLSEWLPYISLNSSTYTDSPHKTFPEDSTAWSLVGQAVRHAYLLRLDRTSFRETVAGESQTELDRKRLAWTCAFVNPFLDVTLTDHGLNSRVPSRSTDLSPDGPVILVKRAIAINEIHGRRLLKSPASVRRRRRPRLDTPVDPRADTALAQCSRHYVLLKFTDIDHDPYGRL